MFAFTTGPDMGWDVFAVSRALRERGWQVPAYTFPANREDLAVLRIVCRNGFSLDLAQSFLTDVRAALSELNEGGTSGVRHEAFHH